MAGSGGDGSRGIGVQTTRILAAKDKAGQLGARLTADVAATKNGAATVGRYIEKRRCLRGGGVLGLLLLVVDVVEKGGSLLLRQVAGSLVAKEGRLLLLLLLRLLKEGRLFILHSRQHVVEAESGASRTGGYAEHCRTTAATTSTTSAIHVDLVVCVGEAEGLRPAGGHHLCGLVEAESRRWRWILTGSRSVEAKRRAARLLWNLSGRLVEGKGSPSIASQRLLLLLMALIIEIKSTIAAMMGR